MVNSLLSNWHGIFVRKKGGEKFGMLLFFAFFGRFGWKEMTKLLMIKGNLSKDSNRLFFVIFGSGQICL